MLHRYTTRLLITTTALTLSIAAGCSDDDDSTGGNGGRGGTGGNAEAGAPDGGGTRANGGTQTAGGTNSAGGSTAGGGLPAQGGEPSSPGGETSAGGSVGGAAAGAGGLGGAADELSDAQIVLVLDTLNQGEVEEAYAARPRLDDPAVEAFAEQMIVEHGDAREAVLDTAEALGLNPEPSPTERDLKAQSESHVALLRTAPGPSVDAPYIELQIAAHAQALQLLNSLQEAADAAELAELIATLEAAVQEHHETALSLQEEL